MTSGLLHDLRLAWRFVRRQPLTSLAVIATLALALGVNVAVFSAVRAVILRPLAFAEEERLVRIYDLRIQPGEESTPIGVTRRNFHALRERLDSAENVVAQRYRDVTLLGDEGPERLVGIGVSEGWLETLGVAPRMGRTFTPEEERLGSESDAVLVSHATWQRRLGGDPDVLGEELRLDGRVYEIVGVLPPGFRYPYEAEVWFPMTFDRDDGRSHNLNVQVRLRSGVSDERFAAELDALARRLATEYPDTNLGYGFKAIPIREVLLGDQHRVLVALYAAVALLLLIACVNVASLMVTSAIGRRRDFALRAALGCGRFRQLRQLAAEGAVIGALGGGLALLIAAVTVDYLETLIPPAMATVRPEISLDASAFAYGLTLALAAGIVCSLAPALGSTRRRLSSELGRGGRGGTGGRQGRRLLGTLVVAEIGLALMLLSGASALLTGFRQLQSQPLGYSPERLATMIVALPEDRYPDAGSRTRFAGRALDAIRALPGVVAAGLTHSFPLPPENNFAVLRIEGRDADPQEQLVVNNRLITPGFFEAMEIPLLRGRAPGPQDRESAEPVAWITRSTAERYWPQEDPLGRRIAWEIGDQRRPWMRIVGIVGDVREPYEVEETWYLPYDQHADSAVAGQLIFTVRSDLEAGRLAAGLRAAIREVDPLLPAFDFAPVKRQIAETLSEERFGALGAAVFSVLGMLLAVLGVYATTSYAVGQRRREWGIRMALGASGGSLLRLVTRDAARPIGLGMTVGILGGVFLVRGLRQLLPETGLPGVGGWIGLALLLTIATLVACQLPARRAARVDPARELRGL